MLVRIEDELYSTLVPAATVIHALAKVAAPTGWKLTEFEVSARNFEVLAPGGYHGLQEQLDNQPYEVDWAWIELFASLATDVESLSLAGTDREGDPLEIVCFDSSSWEIACSPTVAEILTARFDRVSKAPE